MAGWMQDLADFMGKECPGSGNRELLLNYARYFERRTRLLAKNRILRWLFLAVHPSWLRDYLRYGVGIRSLLRDLIVRPVR